MKHSETHPVCQDGSTKSLSRRSILAGATAASAATAVAAVPAIAATPRGRIMELYLEHWRRSDEMFESKPGEDVTDEEMAWIDEPANEAMEIEPQTIEDFGALVLLAFYGGQAMGWDAAVFEWAERAIGMEARV